MKRRFRLSAGMDIDVTVEVDLDKLTPELAQEINDFWCNSKQLLQESNGDLIIAVARRAASEFIYSLLKDDYIDTAQEFLNEQEGWPPNNEHGIKLISYEIPSYCADDLYVTEI